MLLSIPHLDSLLRIVASREKEVAIEKVPNFLAVKPCEQEPAEKE